MEHPLNKWYWLFARKTFSSAQKAWWGGMVEVLFATSLLLAGVILIVVNLTFAFLYSTSDQFYTSIWSFVLQLILGLAMIIVGSLRVVATLWKVGTSVERRGAIVNRAGEIELFNEVRKKRSDLPTVPSAPKPPQRGTTLKYRLLGSRRSSWGLGVATLLAVTLSIIITIVAITAFASLKSEETDWTAFVVLFCLLPPTSWSIYRFVRQLFILAGLGPTQLEISAHPVIAGEPVQLFLTQPGRLRLTLLDVLLVCEEEATYDQGTNIRTERTNVFQQRLFRKRGISVKPNQPFQGEFEFELPRGTMHSFKSANNTVKWKIVVHARAKGWPDFERNFVIPVHPSTASQKQPA